MTSPNGYPAATRRAECSAGFSGRAGDPEYDSGMSDKKARLTITVDPYLSAYAERLVEAGKALSVSAVFNDALAEKERRDRHALDRLKEIAAQADPAKVARMMAYIDTQAAQLPKR